jgi:hypothetical protein
VLKTTVSGTLFPDAIGPAPTDLLVVPPGPLTAPVAHAVELVRMVNVAGTAALPETVELGKEKHAFAIDGLLDTLQATVPV